MRKKYDSMKELSELNWTTFKDKLNDYLETMDTSVPEELTFMVVLEFQFADKKNPLLFFNLGLDHKTYMKTKGLKRAERDAGYGVATISTGKSPTEKIIQLEIKKGKVKETEIEKLLRTAKVFRAKQAVIFGESKEHTAPEMVHSSGTFSKDKIHASLKVLQKDYNQLHEFDFDDRQSFLDQMVSATIEWEKEHPVSPKDGKDTKARRQEVTDLKSFIAEEFIDLDMDKIKVVFQELKEDNSVYKDYKKDNPGKADKLVEFLNDMLKDIQKYEDSKPSLKDKRVKGLFDQLMEAKAKILEERQTVLMTVIDSKATGMATGLALKGLKGIDPSEEGKKELIDKALEAFNKDRDPKLTAKQLMKNKEALEAFAGFAFEQELDNAIGYQAGGDTGRDVLAFGFRANNASTAITGALLAATGKDFLNKELMPKLYTTMTSDNPIDPRNSAFVSQYEFLPEEAEAMRKTYKTLMDYLRSDTSVDKTPDAFKRLAYKASVKAAEKGAHPDGILRYLGGALFLRFINPILTVVSKGQQSFSAYLLTEILNKQANHASFAGPKAQGLDIFDGMLKANEGVIEDFLLRVAAAGAEPPVKPKGLIDALFSKQLAGMKEEVNVIREKITGFNPSSANDSAVKAFYKAYKDLLLLEKHIDKHFSTNKLYGELSDDVSVGVKSLAHRKISAHLRSAAGSLKEYFSTFLTGTKDNEVLKAFNDSYTYYRDLYNTIKPQLEKDTEIGDLAEVRRLFEQTLAIGTEKYNSIGHAWKTAALLEDYTKWSEAEAKLGAKMGNRLLTVDNDIKIDFGNWWRDCGGWISDDMYTYTQTKPDTLKCYVKFEYSGPFYRIAGVHNVKKDANPLVLPRELADA